MDNPQEKKTVKTTLKELGPNLPLGVINGAELSKAIKVKPWRMKEEKELGKLRDENRSENSARWATIVLATMCPQLGELDLASMDMNKRIIHIGQMSMGDVMYAYFWLRYQSLGPSVPMEIACPNCRKEFTLHADLESLIIRTSESYDDTLWEYDLRDPFELRGSQVNGFVISPARWNAIETQNTAGALDVGAAKSSVIRGSIHSVKGIGEALALTDSDLDEMTKFDLESLTTLIDERHIGPDLAVEDKCEQCKRPFRMSLDWSYDSFFGISSH